jgi:hypothetical protein
MRADLFCPQSYISMRSGAEMVAEEEEIGARLRKALSPSRNRFYSG